ncbi:MAG: glycosyltransferase family 39 protein [Anaerolineales bacterium]
MPQPKLLARGLSLLWVTLILLLFYWIHKPLTPTRAAIVGGALLDVLLVGLMLSVGGGIGWRLMGGALARLSRIEGAALACALGLGVLSVAWLAVGVVWLHPISAWAVLLILLGLTFRQIIAWWRLLWDAARAFDPTVIWARGLRAFIILVLGMGLVMALAPPTAFDALTYHLVGPDLWLAEGRITALPGNHFFGFPGLVNTLYAGKLALGDGRLVGVSVVHWAFGLLLILLTGGYAARRFGAWAGLLAGAFLLTVPSLWLTLGWAYVDLAVAAYAMLAFIALDTWREHDSDIWLIIGACGAGLAMSAKYNALLMAVALGLYIVAYNRGRRAATILRAGALYVAVASLVLAPWLLRNLAFFENPVYPFGPETYDWDALKNTWYTGAERAPLRELPALILPIFITPTIAGVEGSGIFNATLSPVFLMLIPLLALSWRHLHPEWRGPLTGLLGLVGVLHLFWLVTAGLSVYGAQTRFMFPLLGWVAVLAAASLEGLRSLSPKPLDIAWMMRAFVLLVFAFTIMDYLGGTRPLPDTPGLQGSTQTNHFLAGRTLEAVVGTIDEETYLNHTLGTHYATMQYLNGELPEGARVLFLWETRSLYCDETRITCIEDTVLYRWWHARRVHGDGSAEDILAAWQTEGITHVLVWETGREFEFDRNPSFTAQDMATWDALSARLVLQDELFDATYRLYTLPGLQGAHFEGQ